MATRVLRFLAAVYLGSLLLAVCLAGLMPVGLQKANAIVAMRRPGALPEIDGSGRALDVREVLSAIPIDPNDDELMVWEIEPDAKYRRTIQEGRGNCSNLVFGLARLLERSGLDYQIVHLLKPDRFLIGKGHTVIRTRYRIEGAEHVGVVDVFAGGLPRSGERFLDVADLEQPIDDFELLSWTGRPRIAERFYREFPGRVVIGWIPARAISRYFRFVEAVYVPFGNARLEKYVYDGLALLLGFYPRILVADVGPLRSPQPLLWALLQVALWVLRSAFLCVPLIAILEWRARRVQRV